MSLPHERGPVIPTGQVLRKSAAHMNVTGHEIPLSVMTHDDAVKPCKLGDLYVKPSNYVEARGGIEPPNKGFADLYQSILTPSHSNHLHIALGGLSYFCVNRGFAADEVAA